MLTQTTLIIIGIGIALSTLILGLIFAYSCAGSRKKAGIQYYNQGITKAKRGDCAGAIAAFNQALRVNSNLVEAYIERGIARAKLGQQQAAIEDFTCVITVNPNDAGAYMNRGNVRANINDMQGALEDYRKAAKLFFEQKDRANYRQALSAFKQLQQQQKRHSPENGSSKVAEEVFNQGLYNIKIGNYKEAIEDFTQVLKLDPQSDKAYYNRGMARFKLSDNQGAKADFTQALKINSSYAEAYLSRGNVYRKLGACQPAIQDFTQALQLKPNDAQAYYNRAITYSELGEKRRSLDDKRKALEDYQKAANLFFDQGDMVNYNRAMKNLPAIEAGEIDPQPAQTISSSPNSTASSTSQNTEDFFNRGLYNFKIGNYKGAIEDFTQFLQLDPQSDKAYYNRGMARFKLSDNQGAKADFTQALKINSSYAEAYLSRGNVYRKLGAYQPAIQDFTQALQLKPNDAHAYYNRAITYSELGEKRRSLDDKRKALEDYQKAANLFFEQGDMVNYNRAVKNLPAIEAGEIDSQPAQNLSSSPSSTTSSRNADRENQRSLPSLKLERKLINLLNGNRSAAERLIEQTRYKNPGKSENWYWEKVIYDLERDRRQ